MLIPIASYTASRVFAGDVPQPPDGGEDTSLEDVARDERDYVRGRLRGELGHEPTDEDIDEWMREHTEGY